MHWIARPEGRRKRAVAGHSRASQAICGRATGGVSLINRHVALDDVDHHMLGDREDVNVND